LKKRKAMESSEGKKERKNAVSRQNRIDASASFLAKRGPIFSTWEVKDCCLQESKGKEK